MPDTSWGDLDSLLAHLPESVDPAAVREHVNFVVNQDGLSGAPWHLGIDGEFLGFLSNYWHLAQILRGHCPERTVVIDVGCCVGWQHLFFEGFLAYVGIDPNVAACRAFLPNCSFWAGWWEDPEIQGRIDQHLEQEWKAGAAVLPDPFRQGRDIRLFGIANMSLLYRANTKVAMPVMHQRFDRLFVV